MYYIRKYPALKYYKYIIIHKSWGYNIQHYDYNKKYCTGIFESC